ncbi:protein BZR1 homolog 3-like [Ananas comosus]|uniref:Protein BZR1 homolog n=1 Tax=Ananas comosus TaxID=4615 RepID=A0A199W642_ANACO|nr:protein BZR1 homolog 3-like [Ananas comosus]OAY84380.1 Protein BZR 3 [Ananas comosus]
MTTGGRLPTWRERENNRRRERRRRAIAAKIYAGLRAHGNYPLPKHCDNNEVLKALCAEAGWTVHPDGTTYRNGCKPPENADIIGGSASPSPCSSYQPSPRASYNPSPSSSSLASPASSSYIAHSSNFINNISNSSLIPWLKNLSSSPASSSKFPHLPSLHIPGGSISAPVTPPISSPTARTPRFKTDFNDLNILPPWASPNCASLLNSTPPSPGRQTGPNPAWLAGIQISSAGPLSPTFSFVSSNPFGIFKEAVAGGSSSQMCTPGQSGTCSPVMGGSAGRGVPDEFAFRSNHVKGLVKAWEGERIHEECGSDELELTLGSSRTRADA